MAAKPTSVRSRQQRSMAAVERVRGQRPDEPSWRADALAGSRHSRLVDELQQPLEVHDLERAREICAAVARQVLRDFAPALMLLPTTQRQRAQALTAYTLTLFDFVRQSGLEGERLAAINRWEFELESALEGKPRGQPVFVLLAHLAHRRSWPRAPFDRLHAYARRRCAVVRPQNRRAAERDALELGTVLAWLLLGYEPSPSLNRFAAAMIRVHGLLELGADLRRHRARLPVTELADSWNGVGGAEPKDLGRPIRAECERLVGTLGEATASAEVAAPLRSSLRYLRLAAHLLLRRIAASGETAVEQPPVLGVASRMALLIRARWLGP